MTLDTQVTNPPIFYIVQILFSHGPPISINCVSILYIIHPLALLFMRKVNIRVTELILLKSIRKFNEHICVGSIQYLLSIKKKVV